MKTMQSNCANGSHMQKTNADEQWPAYKKAAETEASATHITNQHATEIDLHRTNAKTQNNWRT